MMGNMLCACAYNEASGMDSSEESFIRMFFSVAQLG